MFTKKNTIVLIYLVLSYSFILKAENILENLTNISPENRKAYSDARETGNHEKELAALLQIYNSSRDANKKEQVVKFLTEAIDLSIKYKNIKFRTNFLKQKGLIYYRHGDYSGAEKEFIKILSIAEAESNLSLQAQMSSNLGTLMELQGKYDDAIKKYLNSQKIFEELKQYKFAAKVLHNIGVLYTEIKDPNQAIQYFSKALELKKKHSNNREIATTLNGLGTIYEGEIKNYEKALYYYNAALELYEKEKDIKHCTKIMGNIGLVYFQQGKFEKADEYYSKAMNNVVKFPVNDSYRPSIFFNIGMLKLKTGSFDEAIKNFTESIKYSMKFKRINKRLDSYKYLSEAYKQKGQFKKSLETIEKHNELREKTYNENIHKQVSTLQKKFETEKKNQQITLLSKDNEIKSNKLKFIVAFALLLLIVIILLIHLTRMKIGQNKIREDELRQKLLKAQMNPHFLFNALSTIQYLINNDDSAKAYKYLGKFAALTRSILENSEKDFITLEEEIEMLRTYLDLESLCRQGSFDYFIDLDRDLEAEFIMIPPMLIQPFAENAVKHAFKNCEAGNHIEISFNESKDNHINIRISDNGSGISPKGNVDKSKKSMSMDIFRKRIALFEKKYKCKVTHSIRNLNGIEGTGTEIAIKLPIIGETNDL